MARVAFMGSKTSGLAALQAIGRSLRGHELAGVVVPPDERDGRSVLAQMRSVAAELRVPFAIARDGAEHETLASWRPDLVVVVGWYRLVDLDRYPEVAFYGVHYSSLPAYRGSAPVVWQIMRGEPTVGVTLFRFGRGIDSGDIIDQASVPIGPDETIGDILPRLDAASMAILERELPALLSGRASLRPQDQSRATYCAPRRPGDAEIDWARPARQVHDFIRAQAHPYPGAYSWWDGTKVHVWRTQVERAVWVGVPGTVVAHDGDAAVVACGDGAIRVISAEREGGPEGPGATVIDRVGLRLGARTTTLS